MNDTIIKECKTHGSTDFRLSKDRPNGRCKKCSVDAVTKRRKLIKVKAVEYKGGVCEHCDNVYIPEVFEFHHKEPTEKILQYLQMVIPNHGMILKLKLINVYYFALIVIE